MNRAALLATADRVVAGLDALISAQLDTILHDPRFQQLEASWRGLAYLVGEADASANLKIKLLDAGWREVCRDLSRAAEFDRAQIFHKIYETEFDMPGGEPFGLMLGDYTLRHRPGPGHPTDDVAGLKGMAQVAAAAFCPFVAAADPAMFGLDSYDDLAADTDMAASFRQEDYLRWKSFQKDEDARFIGLLLPHVLMRLPYGDDPGRADGFRYRERALDHDALLWGSPVFAFGAVVMRAFANYRWNADIRGVRPDSDAGGRVEGLPVPSFATDRPGTAIKYPTAAYLTERQEYDLCEHGFMPLLNCQYTPYSAFFTAASAQQPASYDGAAAGTNARLSAMLHYMLCVSRFAHYVKVMGREWTGSLLSPEDCQRRLAQWLAGYCTATDDLAPDLKARYPLREAKVTVREREGAPGLYFATIHLKPHFQLDQIVSSFKLVTTLSARPAA